MSNEKHTIEEEQVEVATPNYDLWSSNMRGKYGDDKTDEELFELSMSGYDAEHEAVKRYSAEAQELEEILKSDPDLANVFAEIFERGKDGNPAGALRNLSPELKRYITDENYGDAEYSLDKKKREQEDKEKADKATKQDEMREQAFEDVCAEMGIEDHEAVLEQLQAVLQNPCETPEQCKEQVRAFLKMIDYDSAVEAAEIRGRNANISAQRKKKANTSDGQANTSSASASTRSNEDPLARMASRSAIARSL